MSKLYSKVLIYNNNNKMIKIWTYYTLGGIKIVLRCGGRIFHHTHPVIPVNTSMLTCVNYNELTRIHLFKLAS